MIIELEDTTAGHKPVKVVATEKEWRITIDGEGMNLPNVGTVMVLCRTLDKVLNAVSELT